MILDNSIVLSYMKKDMEYFYYDIVDLKSISNNVTLFSNTLDELINHSFVKATEYDDEILIEIHTDKTSLIAEAISFAKEKEKSRILLSIENDFDISPLSDVFSLEISKDQKHKHWGIFGAIKNPAMLPHTKNVTASAPSQKDIDYIAALPSKEWAFLPQRIKFIKNIYIAKKENDLAGYLVYDSVEAGHCDIVIVYVHPDYRRSGVASALVEKFATECINNNDIPYYVCANSESSAKLAASLNIKAVRKETIVYKLK